MTPREYIQNALRTESTSFQLEDSRILHGAMGCCTEACELLDAVKKHIFYGRPFDKVNAREEIGDICWYIAILCAALGISLEDIWDTNIAKLRLRYPEKFTEDKANNRDLKAERKVLEDLVCPNCLGTGKEGHGELCSVCHGKK